MFATPCHWTRWATALSIIPPWPKQKTRDGVRVRLQIELLQSIASMPSCEQRL